MHDTGIFGCSDCIVAAWQRTAVAKEKAGVEAGLFPESSKRESTPEEGPE